MALDRFRSCQKYIKSECAWNGPTPTKLLGISHKVALLLFECSVGCARTIHVMGDGRKQGHCTTSHAEVFQARMVPETCCNALKLFLTCLFRRPWRWRARPPTSLPAAWHWMPGREQQQVAYRYQLALILIAAETIVCGMPHNALINIWGEEGRGYGWRCHKNNILLVA